MCGLFFSFLYETLRRAALACRSISCWALSRYAQWIVERCNDPQQDVAAAQAQLDEVLQVHSLCMVVPVLMLLWSSIRALQSDVHSSCHLFDCCSHTFLTETLKAVAVILFHMLQSCTPR